MKCPFCGFQNLAGEDECAKCGEDLTAFDALKPKDKLEKSLVKYNLNHLKTSEPAIVDPETSLQTVVQFLAEDNKCVLVMRGETLLGIVTERDILFKVMGKKRTMENTPVSEIMSPNPEVLQGTDSIVLALNKMAMGGFRHVPVFDGAKKIRVVSVRDILGFIAEAFPEAIGANQNR